MDLRRSWRVAWRRARADGPRVGVWVLAGAVLGPALAVGCVRWIEPPATAFMIQRRAADFLGAPVPPIRYEWVGWERIAPAARLAFVAAEDQRFPHHRGFDLESLEEAIEERREGGGLRGASTISQQVAKNLFLWPGRSWIRKGFEAYLTVWIELLWPKRRILEVYLNVAELGDGIYGVQAAAARYFGKPAAELTVDEAVRLAVVLPSPRRYSVTEPSPWLRQRAAWVRRQMQLLGTDYLEVLDER